jgi:hypothetical protein
MKKPIFILRFGKDMLLDVDRLALGELQISEGDILGCSISLGVLSLVLTDESPSDLENRYKDAATMLNDIAPIVVWDPASKDAAFDLTAFPQVFEMISEFEKHNNLSILNTKNEVITCNMSLDELLDKVSQSGQNSLTPLEFDRLKSFSK